MCNMHTTLSSPLLFFLLTSNDFGGALWLARRWSSRHATLPTRPRWSSLPGFPPDHQPHPCPNRSHAAAETARVGRPHPHLSCVVLARSGPPLAYPCPAVSPPPLSPPPPLPSLVPPPPLPLRLPTTTRLPTSSPPRACWNLPSSTCSSSGGVLLRPCPSSPAPLRMVPTARIGLVRDGAGGG
jgi:hypothetical protein